MSVLVVIVAVVVIRGVTGEERSAAAVCEVFETEGAALHDRFEESADSLSRDQDGDQLLSGIAELIAAPGRFAHLMDKMAAVAPKDVEPAFAALADAFRKVAENAGENATNPIGAIASGVLTGAQVQGQWEEANRLLSENCARPK